MGIAGNTFCDKTVNRYGPIKLPLLSRVMLAWPGFLPVNVRDWLVGPARAFRKSVPSSLTVSVIGVSVKSVPALIHLFMCVAYDWSVGPLKSVPSFVISVCDWLM